MIDIGDYNDCLTSATIHYNSSMPVSQEELQEEYIYEHLEYYNGSYETEIVSASSTAGLAFMMEDASGDLSDDFYEVLSTLTTVLDLSNYAQIEIESVENLTISIDCDPLDNVDTYSAIIYQLMANDEVYSGIQDTFSLGMEKNIVSLAKTIMSNAADLMKDELKEEAIDSAITALNSALDLLDEMDSDSDDYEDAWQNFSDLCNEYFDDEKALSFFESACNVKDSVFEGISVVLNQVNTFGEAYQFMCLAETYSETCEYFEKVLEDMSTAAKEKYELELSMDKYEAVTPGSDGYNYKCIYNAIDEWLEKMDAYEEAAFEAFADEVVNGTLTNFAQMEMDSVVDMVSDLIPFLGPMNKALKAGKLGIDMFTTIDDEYKASYTASCLSYIVDLLVTVSNDYGEDLVVGNSFENALLFDESINIYKNAVLLACDYGVKYEKLKLASVAVDEKYQPLSEGTAWYYSTSQMAASTCSTALSMLALQKMETSDIHCHDDGLTYDNSTGLIKYDGSTRVVSAYCPVDITIYDENGTQIAYLSDGVAEVASGYEHYFFVVPEDEEETDYIKVAIVPDDKNYEIVINGTGDGTMTLYVGRYDGETITGMETFANVVVTDSTEGYLDSGDDENNLGYLVFNNITYGEALADSDINQDDEANQNDGTSQDTSTSGDEGTNEGENTSTDENKNTSGSTNEGESTNQNADITLGDINGDGFIDYLDAMVALRYDAELVTLNDDQLLAGDVNGDGSVDSLDAILILRYDAGLIENFAA